MKTKYSHPYTRRNIEPLIFVLLFILNSCSDNLIEPSLAGNIICYQKKVDGYWEIFSNNLSGINYLNISRYEDDDEYPAWSPDGRYIAFLRSQRVGSPICIINDIKKKSYTNIITDGGGVVRPPGWTLDKKVYLSYSNPLGAPPATFLMNPDGSNKIKILDYAADIYFYNDGYSFLYVKNNRVFRTNTSNTAEEFILDCNPGDGRYISIRDFNPVNETFLVNTNYFNENSSDLAEYNVRTRQLYLLLRTEADYQITLQKYSKDYSVICFIEDNIKTYKESYLSIFKNGEKRRLLKLSDNEKIDFNPMQFSPDGRFIAFSKNIYKSGSWVSWESYLYAINIYNGELHYIDSGIFPSWNPQSNK